MTRFDDNNQTTQEDKNCNNCDKIPNTTEYQENHSESVLENVNVPTPSDKTSLPLSIAHIREEEELHETMEKNPIKTPENNNTSEPLIPETVNSVSVSSSDLNLSSFPLKERNFLPKLRESTSFDPRESIIPRNLVISDNNGKENKNSQTESIEDNTIQCNEVSSSNIDIDNVSNEEEEAECSSVKNERHNLRSTKKGKSIDSRESEEEEKVKVSFFYCFFSDDIMLGYHFILPSYIIESEIRV